MKKEKISKVLLMTALITGMCIGGVQGVSAAENPMEFALDEYVVTATRYEKRAVDVAASVEVFDQERLQATGASNLYEAMQFATGIAIQQYGNGGSSMGNMTSKVGIRGNGNGTLVLVNGIPINIRGTYDLNDIQVENVERVEIVRGGGSVLYGSDATGGVINIITKKERQNYVKAAVGNYGQQEYVASVQAGNLGFSYKYSKWGDIYHVGSDRSTGANVRDWQGPENNNFELTYKFNDNLSLIASHNESVYNYITPGTTITDVEQDIKRNNIQLNYQDDNFKTTIYYLDRSRDKYQVKGNNISTDDEMSKNYGLDMQKSFGMKDATLLVGASYQNENFDCVGQANRMGDPNTYGNRSRDNYSIYAQYDKQLSKANSIVLSARETWTGNAPNGQNFDNFSGQAQFIHKLNDNESLYASAGQSFKMPALYQIYKTEIAGADLQSQEGTHYEIGWKKDIDDNRSLRVALFNYEIENNITAENLGDGEFKYENENIRNTGIEAEYTLYSPKGFGYNVSASYGNPETQSIDGATDYGWQEDNTKFELKAGLTYKLDKWKAAMNAAYVAGRHYTKTGNVYDAKPYLLTNLNVEYQANKNISFFTSINNILDRNDISFFNDGTEYYATPINFLVGMKYSF